MANREIVKKYSNDEMTIVWQPAKCIHSSVCVKTLPKVYRRDSRPWIVMDNATTEELKSQVGQCPSGALTYYLNDEVETTHETTLTPLPNGPLLIKGEIRVTDKNGNVEIKTGANAFCRCGGSSSKPYCDGTHKKIGFEG
jgi:uncharacterized Fe-S cluster protein YjdI